MSERSDAHSELSRLIAGELDPDSFEGREVLAAASMDREELEELRELASELDLAAEFREKVAADAEELDDAPGLERVRETLRSAELPPRTTEPTGRRWLDWVLPLAAAVLAVPLILFYVDRDGGEERLLSSDGEGATIVRPVGGPLDEYGPVEWLVDEPELGDEVRLLVYDEEDERRVEPRFEYVLEESPWSDPDEQEQWPDAVFLRLEVQRLAPNDRASAWAYAWRSR